MFINEQVIMFWDMQQIDEEFDFAETLLNSKLLLTFSTLSVEPNMTTQEFCIWLSRYLESGGTNPGKIEEMLDTVDIYDTPFKTNIPPSALGGFDCIRSLN